MNSVTETEMLQIALDAAENTSGTIWEVMGWLNDEIVAVAAFSQQQYAQLLALYLKDYGDPFDTDSLPEPVIEPVGKNSTETQLQIDKYLPELKAGKLPFDIQMYKDGRLFEAERSNTVYEPVITHHYLSMDNTNLLGAQKEAALSGTFWAGTKSEAIQLAEQHLLDLSAQGLLY